MKSVTCFECLDGSFEAEWAAVQKYFMIWHNSPANNNTMNLPEVFTTNSVAIKEWAKLTRTLQDAKLEKALRDYIRFEEVPNQQAIGFLWQCEGDFIWAIERENWYKPNPRVVGFILDYDASETVFLPMGLIAGSLSEFALTHSSHFLYQTYANAIVTIPIDQTWLAEMESQFTVVKQIGETRIFENPGVIALITTDIFEPDTHHLTVAVKHAESFENCPEACLKYLKNGGAFSGYFSEESFRNADQLSSKKNGSDNYHTKPFWKFW